MTQTEALKLALEELENCADLLKVFEAPVDSCIGAAMLGAENAVTAIKEALAQPEQEPVVYRPRLERVKGNDFEEWRKNISPELYSAGDAVLCWVNEGDLYMPTPPQQEPVGFAVMQKPWVGLTDDEFEDIELGCRSTPFGKIEAMRMVEAKLKEKNA